MGFEAIVGNEKIKQVLKQAVSHHMVSHSYLFIGPEGIGKRLFAREFAKMLLCLEKNTACGTCKSCMELDSQNHPDYMEIQPDGNAIKIEQIRMLQSKVIEKPIISSQKVYVINDSDKMTKEAQNCLLKTLEEPPQYVTIILIGSNETMYLNTIKSRCTKIAFQEIEEQVLRTYLAEKEGMTDIPDSFVKLLGGSIAKAQKLKEKQATYEQIEKLLDKMKTHTMLDIWKMEDCFRKNKEDIIDLLDITNVILYHKAMEDPMRAICYLNSMQIVEKTKKRIKSNSNFDMSIDGLLLSIWEEIHEENSRG